MRWHIEIWDVYPAWGDAEDPEFAEAADGEAGADGERGGECGRNDYCDEVQCSDHDGNPWHLRRR